MPRILISFRHAPSAHSALVSWLTSNQQKRFAIAWWGSCLKCFILQDATARLVCPSARQVTVLVTFAQQASLWSDECVKMVEYDMQERERDSRQHNSSCASLLFFCLCRLLPAPHSAIHLAMSTAASPGACANAHLTPCKEGWSFLEDRAASMTFAQGSPLGFLYAC